MAVNNINKPHKLRFIMPLVVLSALIVGCNGKTIEMDNINQHEDVKSFYKTIKIEKDKVYKFHISDVSKILYEGTIEDNDGVFIAIKSNVVSADPNKSLLLDEIYQDSIKIRTNKELTKVAFDKSTDLPKDCWRFDEDDGFKGKVCCSIGVGTFTSSCKSFEIEFKSKVNADLTAYFQLNW